MDRAAQPCGATSGREKLWINQTLPHPPQSVETARQLLKSAGYSWNSAGQLQDSTGAAGRIHDHHEFVEQPAHENGDAAAGQICRTSACRCMWFRWNSAP
jgi:hypothetical protein